MNIDTLKIFFIISAVAAKQDIDNIAKRKWYYRHLPKKISHAFTLAEVLITLAVIGVVAAMSVPALQKSFQESEYKTGYKAAFRDLTVAFKQAKTNYELVALENGTDTANMKINLQAIGSHFNKVKECDGTTLPKCWDMTGELFSAGTPSNIDSAYSFIDSKGRNWTYRNVASCYIIFVDINGFKKPNIYGKDRFPILLAFQSHIDDPNAGWAADYLTASGIPIKVHPFSDRPKNADFNDGGYSCTLEKCYYKSWLIGN